MSLLIKNWSEADWKELLKWAKIGANNAMIGEYAEVEELPPHGRLIDSDALMETAAKMVPWCITDPGANSFLDGLSAVYEAVKAAPTIIEAEGRE